MRLKNLVVGDNGIEKRVVWSTANSTWAGVCSAYRSTELSREEQGTFQVALPGDILIRSYLNEDDDMEITFSKLIWVDDDTQEIKCEQLDLNTNLYQLTKYLTYQVTNWLGNLAGVGDSYLPAGIGWDGRFSLYDQNKRDKIRTLLYGCRDEILISRLIDAGQISARSNVPLEWSDALLLSQSEPCVLNWDVTPVTNMVFAIQWLPNDKTVVYTTTNPNHFNNEFFVQNEAIKVIIGSFNQGRDPGKPLVNWRLYTR